MKPKIKDALVQGILTFWHTVDFQKCRRYISHLNKVIPRMIELQATECKDYFIYVWTLRTVVFTVAVAVSPSMYIRLFLLFYDVDRINL